jgi:PLP dependent protein
MPTIAENLNRLEEQIGEACGRAGRHRGDVQLMAVSKLHPVEALREAAAAGLSLFGENRVQEWAQKAPALAEFDLEVHLIGHLQSNKAARAAEIFTAVDTVDSVRLAEKLNEAAQKLAGTLPVLIEVKLSPEEAKTGLDPRDLPQMLDRLADLPNLRLRGLMTVPPWSEDPETARPYFAQLRKLRDQLAAARPSLDLSQLSMGMSGDFAVAIEEGATCIRIGTAIFGRRQAPAQAGA